MQRIPRAEHPRPDFMRENWLCLNGEWAFSFDAPVFDRTIVVPFACETALSGIQDTGFHEAVWYRRSFTLPAAMREKRVFLHFGAVDYACRLWVNDRFIREHTGGQCSFFADITDAIQPEGENVITLEVHDDPADLEMPRGKQYWKPESEGCFYTRTTGIWQSVWLEAVSALHLRACRITPDFDTYNVRFDYELSHGAENARFEAEIRFGGARMGTVSAQSASAFGHVTWQLEPAACPQIRLPEEYAWTPEQPNLFDVTFRVYDGQAQTDEVQSYFGLRKISVQDGRLYLNNRLYYQRLLLDQGYWPQSLLTAPEDEAFIRDIELTKAMGFNGVRKHQKVEDPRYLYHADRLGLLVWGEIGAAYRYSVRYADRFYREWLDVLQRDYNHPCIIVWTPLNESWGVMECAADPRQQAHIAALVSLTKSMDATRLVSDNDGWEHTCGDLLTFHSYASSGDTLRRMFASLDALSAQEGGYKPLYVGGYSYHGQPVMLTEFGGVKYVPEGCADRSWGYCEAATAESFAEKLCELFSAVRDCPLLQGYCYTQLTDVENEQNGLLTYDRTPKLPLETIRRIVLGEG